MRWLTSVSPEQFPAVDGEFHAGDKAPSATTELADPAARRLATAGPWADLEAADEHRVMTEWRRHISGWQALEAVEAAPPRQAAAAPALDEAVRAALAAGAPWADIGRFTGITRRSA